MYSLLVTTIKESRVGAGVGVTTSQLSFCNRFEADIAYEILLQDYSSAVGKIRCKRVVEKLYE